MDDLISRQAAIEALTGWETEPTDEEIEFTLKHVPTVQPKTGHWIKGKNIIQCYGYEDGKEVPRDTIYEYFECSECKNRVIYEETNYCPNCGVRMIEEGD